MGNLYNREFYNEMTERNSKTASIMIPLILDCLNPASMIDIGCGQGLFLQEAEKRGIEILGIDGDYVDKDLLCINKSCFKAADISKELVLKKKYDIALSLEVAEHIAPEDAELFIDNLTHSSNIIIFSAAIPNQGGVGHINEQWPSYWKKKFDKRGYRVSNCLRKCFWNETISPLRKQNILLYAKSEIYDAVVGKIETKISELLDVIHPEYFEQKINMVGASQKKLEYLSSLVSVLEAEKIDYKKIAKKMNRQRLWQLADNLDVIVHLMEEPFFRDNFECYQLDNFEKATNKKNYVVWGAGEDGRKIQRLLRLLNKKITFWCDSKLSGSEVNGIKISSIEETINHYHNEIIIIASRKYQDEITDQLTTVTPMLKDAIFEFNINQAKRRHDEEYKKAKVLSYPPLWLTIGITSACSNKCLFCSYHGEDAKNISNVYGLPFMLSYQDFVRIVDMAKEERVPQIHICGTGEPFFNPDVLKMIDYAIKQYGEVSLQTEFQKNLFEKKSYLDELIKREKNITYIATDVLSSIPEEHDRIKKGTSYHDFLEVMSYIGKNSNLKIRINVILTKQNYQRIEGIADALLERNVDFELLIVNLLSYDYSDFTSSDNVYTSVDSDITKELEFVQEYCRKKNIKVEVPSPADSENEDCYVFWTEFQTWPVKGCVKEHYGDNMIPHACAAVVRGELNSIGYLFDYNNIMDAWNNKKLVKIREDMMNGKYPSDWCKKCSFYNEDDSYFKLKCNIKNEL